ncbi:MAG: ferredoxin [Hyphomicrobiaceae bacterium]
MPLLNDIKNAARVVCLAMRGGFHVQDYDGVPACADGRAARTIVLLGNVGSTFWPAFSTSPEFRDGKDHPLDRWTRRVTGHLAAALGAEPLYPFDGPPHWPFQRWAQRAEAVHPSPLGLLIHPDHGLWHAYRAALVFGEAIELPAHDRRPSPCDTCADKPCLSSCPVGAFTGTNYDVGACAAHIASAAGTDCMDLGCRARRTCPIGSQLAYQLDHARFHMDAFLRSQLAEKRRLG